MIDPRKRIDALGVYNHTFSQMNNQTRVNDPVIVNCSDITDSIVDTTNSSLRFDYEEGTGEDFRRAFGMFALQKIKEQSKQSDVNDNTYLAYMFLLLDNFIHTKFGLSTPEDAVEHVRNAFPSFINIAVLSLSYNTLLSAEIGGSDKGYELSIKKNIRAVMKESNYFFFPLIKEPYISIKLLSCLLLNWPIDSGITSTQSDNSHLSS